MLESFFLQHARVHIIFEMTIVEWQTYAVQAQAGKEFGVCFGKEVFEELVEEKGVLFGTKDF